MPTKFAARRALAALIGLTLLSASAAGATPLLVMDARTGQVLVEQEATRPWYPASLTKLVTVYVALKAVRQGRLKLDTPLLVSTRAARMPPSKMGFKPGQEVTLDNALKMLMVKSANDLAVTVAEGVSGSVESFAVEMNRVAAELGMRESHFVNPNGLHNPAHVSSARDMGVIGAALFRDFPEHADLFGIGALSLNGKIIPTHNGIMGRYPGADGMKTGFVCASGFNVVASATRGGRRLIVVVMGYPNAKSRTLKAASLFDEGFGASTGGPVATALPTTGGGAPDIRQDICRRHRVEVAEDDFQVPITGYAAPALASGDDSSALFFANDRRPAPASPAASMTAESLLARPYFDPVPVFVGRAPGWNGPVAGARAAPVARSPAPSKAQIAHASEPIAKPIPATDEAVKQKAAGKAGPAQLHKAGSKRTASLEKKVAAAKPANAKKTLTPAERKKLKAH